MQVPNKLAQTNNLNTQVNSSDKDIRQRLHEALRRFGYKQVDVSKETSKLIRHSPLDPFVMAAGQNQGPPGPHRGNHRAVAPEPLLQQASLHQELLLAILHRPRKQRFIRGRPGVLEFAAKRLGRVYPDSNIAEPQWQH